VIYVINADFKSLPLSTFEGVDHMISDPPYSGHTHTKAVSTGIGGRGPVQRDLGFEALTEADRVACIKIAKSLPRWTILFSDFAHGEGDFDGDPEAQAQAGHYLIEGDAAWRFAGVHGGLEWIRLVPWIRWSQPQITGDRPGTGAEAVLHFHAKGRKRWNGAGGMTHYSRTALRGADKHPTEKPLDLMLDLVAFFTEPGEAIVDPFAGAGTTGLAAALLGRDAILVERNPEWSRFANERCSAPSEKDRARALAWASDTIAQGEAEQKEPSSTENAIRRAQHRIDDALRVREALR
jgi:site-specific DNA-methyltransferase (adenine-specific)